MHFKAELYTIYKTCLLVCVILYIQYNTVFESCQSLNNTVVINVGEQICQYSIMQHFNHSKMFSKKKNKSRVVIFLTVWVGRKNCKFFKDNKCFMGSAMFVIPQQNFAKQTFNNFKSSRLISTSKRNKLNISMVDFLTIWSLRGYFFLFGMATSLLTPCLFCY